MTSASSLADLDAVEARRLTGRKQISPVELLEACLARIDALNPAINAVVARCDDRARAEAAFAACLSGHAECAIEFRNVWPDGSEH